MAAAAQDPLVITITPAKDVIKKSEALISSVMTNFASSPRLMGCDDFPTWMANVQSAMDAVVDVAGAPLWSPSYA